MQYFLLSLYLLLNISSLYFVEISIKYSLVSTLLSSLCLLVVLSCVLEKVYCCTLLVIACLWKSMLSFCVLLLFAQDRSRELVQRPLRRNKLFDRAKDVLV